MLLLSLARLTVVEHPIEIHLDSRILGLELGEHVLDIAHDTLQVYHVLTILSPGTWGLVRGALVVLPGLVGAALGEALSVHVAHVGLHSRNTVQELLEIRIVGVEVMRASLTSMSRYV